MSLWAEGLWAEGLWSEVWHEGEGGDEPVVDKPVAVAGHGGGWGKRRTIRHAVHHDGKQFVFWSEQEALDFLDSLAKKAEETISKAVEYVEKKKPHKTRAVEKAKESFEKLASTVLPEVQDNSSLKTALADIQERLDFLMEEIRQDKDDEEMAIVIYASMRFL